MSGGRLQRWPSLVCFVFHKTPLFFSFFLFSFFFATQRGKGRHDDDGILSYTRSLPPSLSLSFSRGPCPMSSSTLIPDVFFFSPKKI